VEPHHDPATAIRIDERSSRTTGARTISTHLIEEYARHNGHADLLREAIDGVTGEEAPRSALTWSVPAGKTHRP
jgi:hypothetical protein